MGSREFEFYFWGLNNARIKFHQGDYLISLIPSQN